MQELKKKLRSALIARRKAMEKGYREFLDEKIYNNLIGLDEVKNARIILTYASSEIEVDTNRLIDYALENRIIVAVPKCFGKDMKFLVIKSRDELVKSPFGVPEPKDGEEITDFSEAVCITPALSFDKNGYRLGYGGGFYDRFFENYNGLSIGICYGEFCGDIPLGSHDINVDRVITENGLFYGKDDSCG